MAFVPAPGIAEFVQKFSTPGGNALNIWHVEHDDLSGWSAAQLTSMGTIISNWEQATGRLRRTADFTCTGILCRDLTSQFSAETNISGNSAGSLAGASLPDNVTIAIKKESGLAGRAFRGRCYWVGLSASQQTKDTYAGGEIANIISALNTLLAAINAVANCHMVILQSQINKVHLNPRVAVRILDFTNTDGTLDSQRRRLLAHNIHH